MNATTKRKRSDLKRYVRTLQDAMGLRDWRVILMSAPPEPDDDGSRNAAAVRIVHGQRRAELHISEEWMDWEPEYLSETIVHELVHLFLEPVADVFEAVSGNMSSDLASTTEYYFRRDLEQGVDAISVAWARTLPRWADAEPKEKTR